MIVLNEVHAEPARRWMVDASAITAAVAGSVSVGLPERAVQLPWGEPASRVRADDAQAWHYRTMAGEQPRRVVFRNGIVSEVYPPGGYWARAMKKLAAASVLAGMQVSQKPRRAPELLRGAAPAHHPLKTSLPGLLHRYPLFPFNPRTQR